MADDHSPWNQTLPPELNDVNDVEEEALPEYNLQDASRQMLSGTADVTGNSQSSPGYCFFVFY